MKTRLVYADFSCNHPGFLPIFDTAIQAPLFLTSDKMSNIVRWTGNNEFLPPFKSIARKFAGSVVKNALSTGVPAGIAVATGVLAINLTILIVIVVAVLSGMTNTFDWAMNEKERREEKHRLEEEENRREEEKLRREEEERTRHMEQLQEERNSDFKIKNNKTQEISKKQIELLSDNDRAVRVVEADLMSDISIGDKTKACMTLRKSLSNFLKYLSVEIDSKLTEFNCPSQEQRFIPELLDININILMRRPGTERIVPIARTLDCRMDVEYSIDEIPLPIARLMLKAGSFKGFEIDENPLKNHMDDPLFENHVNKNINYARDRYGSVLVMRLDNVPWWTERKLWNNIGDGYPGVVCVESRTVGRISSNNVAPILIAEVITRNMNCIRQVAFTLGRLSAVGTRLTHTEGNTGTPPGPSEGVSNPSGSPPSEI